MALSYWAGSSIFRPAEQGILTFLRVYGILKLMKGPDLDRQRSEKSRSLGEFLKLYNESLPLAFPRASTSLLEDFRSAHANLFKSNSVWSLDLHRKKVMDWLRARPV